MLLPQILTIGQNIRYTQQDIDADENDNITHGMLGQPKDLDTGFYIAVSFDSETVYYPGTGIIPFHNNATIYIPLYKSLGNNNQVGGTGADADTPFEFEMGKKYTFLLELRELEQVTFTVGETGWEQTVTVPISGIPE